MDQGSSHLPDLGVPVVSTPLQDLSGARIVNERKSDHSRHANRRKVFLPPGQETLNREHPLKKIDPPGISDLS